MPVEVKVSCGKTELQGPHTSIINQGLLHVKYNSQGLLEIPGPQTQEVRLSTNNIGACNHHC